MRGLLWWLDQMTWGDALVVGVEILAGGLKNVLQCKALLKRSGLHLAGAEEVEEI